jgi:ABC-2 type transport system ATP-binding protein
LIEVKNLTKRYGLHTAIDHLSFRIEKGEIVGFLGPNGAGKSTTMNIVTGYISATEGNVSVGGKDVLEEPMEVKKQIGYLPEQPPLYLEMTVGEYLDFVANIKRVSRKGRKDALDAIMDTVKILDHKDRLIKNLSKGYRQRVGLAQALVGNPPVLILDEPTIGLDPRQIIEIRNLIKDLGREHTIVLSSHILPEVTAVCERVIIIHRGRIVASDSIDKLSADMSGGHKLTVRVAGPEDRALAAIRAVAAVTSVESLGSREEGSTDLYVESSAKEDVRRPVFYAMAKADCPILMMRSSDVSLEDIFIQLTRDEPGQEPVSQAAGSGGAFGQNGEVSQ